MSYFETEQTYDQKGTLTGTRQVPISADAYYSSQVDAALKAALAALQAIVTSTAALAVRTAPPAGTLTTAQMSTWIRTYDTDVKALAGNIGTIATAARNVIRRATGDYTGVG